MRPGPTLQTSLMSNPRALSLSLFSLSLVTPRRHQNGKFPQISRSDHPSFNAAVGANPGAFRCEMGFGGDLVHAQGQQPGPALAPVNVAIRELRIWDCARMGEKWGLKSMQNQWGLSFHIHPFYTPKTPKRQIYANFNKLSALVQRCGGANQGAFRCKMGCWGSTCA